ncbi:hypothetical protein GGU11DRAFT_670145, partial [Lentinula aff. detonsa]
VEIRSLTSDHSHVLKGIDALIHPAFPVFMNGVTGQELFSVRSLVVVLVTLVRQAIAPGEKKFILTGTFVDLFD